MNSLSRPGNVSAELTVVTNEWWGNYNHRAFNISKGSSTQIYSTDSDNFRIYVPVAKREALNADDKAYLTELGLNPDEYLALDLSYVLHAYYNSSKNNSSIVKDGTDFCAKYLCTQIFSRYDITIGSIIRVKSGYQYRPEGRMNLNQNNSNRPAITAATTTVVDSVWWGSWNYRAFNLSNKDGSSALTDAEALSLRIYVKIS
jgi:hypothetical protein